MSSFFVDKQAIDNTAVELGWISSYDERLLEFAKTSAQVLFVYINRCGKLVLDYQFPVEVHEQHSDVLYVLKYSCDSPESSQGFVSGYLSGKNAVESLVEQMEELYMPTLSDESYNWPDKLQNDFLGQLHHFMSTLIETSHEQQGQTILYVPHIFLNKDVSKMRQNCELVQQLESCLLHWTEQIHEVLARLERAATQKF